MIKGYKAFNSDKTNRYGFPFESGNTYSVDGEIKFGNEGNGYQLDQKDIYERYYGSRDIGFINNELSLRKVKKDGQNNS